MIRKIDFWSLSLDSMVLGWVNKNPILNHAWPKVR